MAGKKPIKTRGPYNGAGEMKNEVQRNYLKRKVDQGEKDRKRSNDRLRYLLRKESKKTLANSERKEQKEIESKV